jgi:hypothetical protein
MTDGLIPAQGQRVVARLEGSKEEAIIIEVESV